MLNAANEQIDAKSIAAPVVQQVAKEPESPTEKPTVKRIIRKGGSFTPSITDALNGRMSNEEKVEEPRDLVKYYTENDLEEPFSKEQMKEKWLWFIKRYEDRPNLFTVLSNVPDLNEKYQLLLSVGSATMDEEIRLIKPDLVSWLRSELRNSRLELITRVEAQKTQRVIYSDSEKLQVMINKNPQLGILKQKFGLDFNE